MCAKKSFIFVHGEVFDTVAYSYRWWKTMMCHIVMAFILLTVNCNFYSVGNCV